jgi:hypothetical protein
VRSAFALDRDRIESFRRQILLPVDLEGHAVGRFDFALFLE